MSAIDLFAGAGGWDLAARELGVEPLGIEWDDAACATRKAAGMRTLQADVSALDPMDFAPCDLLIASPSCTAFGNAIPPLLAKAILGALLDNRYHRYA